MAQPGRLESQPIDPILTNLSIGFRNADAIWNMVCTCRPD